MMDDHYICHNQERRAKVREAQLNGLDYVEVSEDQLELTVTFLGKAPAHGLKPANVRFTGGRRIRDVRATRVEIKRQPDPDLDDLLIVTVNQPGDFSTYSLCLVDLDAKGRPTERPFPGFDPRYACLEFSFKAGCPGDLDCKTQDLCPPPEREEPEINYLAKDYASFRQLILDRLALIMPGWQERHVPDLGITLVELLAYAGDHLSYYQDAVATEAYLDTARQRISVRRHARLVDYILHEGSNARAWVCLATDTDLTLDPNTTSLITGYNDALDLRERVLTWDDLRDVPASEYEVFEPLVDSAERIQLYAAHTQMHFYTWLDTECCLPRGATRATLKDAWLREAEPEPKRPKPYHQAAQMQTSEVPVPDPPQTERRRKLEHLRAGDVLILEEAIGPKTGNPADADPAHRHAVRLTRVTPGEDPLNGQPIVEIEWAREDALPFPLCLSVVGPPPDCELLPHVSVACGNVILVDHGRTIPDESLGSVPVARIEERCESDCEPAEVTKVPAKFRPPPLEEAGLTFAQPLDPGAPASAVVRPAPDPRQALPAIRLASSPAPSGCDDPEWTARRDLLDSGPRECHFVVEMDDDRRAHLRFGDGELGHLPDAGMAFTATYRVGSGAAGNVGRESISHLVSDRLISGAGLEPRNPMPARGGIDPEPLSEAKLFAPHAHRWELQRAITEDDYAQIVMQAYGDRIQRAAARLRWTGSWYEALVAVDPIGQVEAGQALRDEVRDYLEPYRRIGHDLAVGPARDVPLDLELLVCVEPDYLRGHVKAALLDLFSSRVLPGGGRGLFHPDEWTFGQDVFLSVLVAAAQAVPGVESVQVIKLERLFEGPNGEIRNGVLPLGPLEVARLDNDPSFPENGRLALDVRGGR